MPQNHIYFMNYFFKITSLAGLCLLFNSLTAQNKSKTTTRIIEIQNGDTIRNETIVTDHHPDHDPQQKKKDNYSFNYNFDADNMEREMEKAMKELEKGLKELDNIKLHIDLSDLNKDMEKLARELSRLSEVKIDTKTKKKPGGKKETQITIRGPRGNNQVIIIDKKGNLKTKKEFDKKKAKEWEEKEKIRAKEREQKAALHKEQHALKNQQKEIEEQKKLAEEKKRPTAHRAPKFMMSTEDNKIYNFEIETESDSEVEIEIKNEKDKVLLKEIEPQGKRFERKINLGKFGAGTYTITLTQSGKEISKHVILITE